MNLIIAQGHFYVALTQSVTSELVVLSYISVLHLQCHACDDRLCCLSSAEHNAQVFHASPHVSCLCSLDTSCIQGSFQQP